MDIKQDPNSIPNFHGSGRIGELQPEEPEQVQSSVQLDTDDEDDGAVPSAKKPAAGADPSQTGAGAIDGLVGAP